MVITRYKHSSENILGTNIFVGDLDLRRVQQLGDMARGTDPNSGMYNVIADTIIAIGAFLYSSVAGVA